MKMLPRRVEFFQGLPASGKTTLAKEMMKAYEGNGYTTFRANKDDIRDALRRKNSPFKEKDVVERETDMVREAMGLGINYILIDNTHFNPVHEGRYRMMAAEHGYDFNVVDLTHVPVEVCIGRDRARENPVGAEVIHKMWRENLCPTSDAIVEKYEPKPGTPSAIICDLDGTLAEITNRSHYDGHKCYDDTVREAVALTLAGVSAHVQHFLFVSGRPEMARQETMRWLRDKTPWAVSGWGIRLYMRQDGDFRKDAVVKREIFDKHIRNQFNVKLVLDDRNSVVDMWRSLGLECFQVAPGNF